MLREAKNEAKRGQGRLRDTKIEAKRRPRKGQEGPKGSKNHRSDRKVSNFGAPGLPKGSKILEK